MNVNDLLSSPNVVDDPSSKKRPRADTITGPQQQPLEVTVPTISELNARFPTRSALHAHLSSLPRPMLIAMLLAENKDAAGPADKLEHCAYCHQLYDKSVQDAGDCKVKHFGNLEGDDGGDTRTWDCCGLEVHGYDEYDEDERYHAPPEDSESPYCYEGRHREILVSDEEAATEADNGEVWWSEFEVRGPNCKELKCYEKVNGGHVDKRTKSGY